MLDVSPEPNSDGHEETFALNRTTRTSQSRKHSTSVLSPDSQRSSHLDLQVLSPNSSSSTIHARTIHRESAQPKGKVDADTDSRQRVQLVRTATHLDTGMPASEDQDDEERRLEERERIWEQAKPIAERFIETAIRDDARMRHILQKWEDGLLVRDTADPDWNLFFMRWTHDHQGRRQALFYAHGFVLGRFTEIRRRKERERWQTALRSKVNDWLSGCGDPGELIEME